MEDDEIRCPKKGCRGHIEPNWIIPETGIEQFGGFMEAGKFENGNYAIEQDMSLYHCTTCGCQFALED